MGSSFMIVCKHAHAVFACTQMSFQVTTASVNGFMQCNQYHSQEAAMPESIWRVSHHVTCDQIILHISPGLTKNWLADSSVTLSGTATCNTSMKLRVASSCVMALVLHLHRQQISCKMLWGPCHHTSA